MRSSIKRRWFQIRRVFRHQTFLFILFTLIIGGFILFLVSPTNIFEKESFINAEDVRNVRKNFDDELADIIDLETILKVNEIGNFENVPNLNINNNRTAPGEGGKPVVMNMNTVEVRSANRNYGFNILASDIISLNRTIPDVRMNECKFWHYPEDLPTASVIIAFHNEGWTPLLRTMHSVILRSPPNLLREVILVDDYSDKEHLKEKLEDYLADFGDKVRLIRNKEREGLIRTRTNGAKIARGEVVIFLDAHCEVNRNWLPPLLAPIRRNRKIMTVPVIDDINMNTWEYRRVYSEANSHFRGIFEWGLLYKETELSPEEKKYRKFDSQPFRSPTHAGGLFAIDKNWFSELGYYDSGLQIWGGEQYELSFKIWQCGGGILFIPCSHVGHVYRNHMPYGFGKLSGKPVISTNLIRVIKTWMDEYGKYYYIREPQALNQEPGDISEQLKLREQLQCKSFAWYMEKVAYDIPRSYPILPENLVWGEAKNIKTGKCIDSMGRAIPGIMGATPCHGYGGNQLIRLNKEGQMAQGEWCITPYHNELRSNHCRKGTVNGPFKYIKESRKIMNFEDNTCLAPSPDSNSNSLILVLCVDGDTLQEWVWTEKYT